MNIDGLNFSFPATWQASKYDEWIYYREHFSKQIEGLRAVDIIAVSQQGTAWLIEVKDYRHPQAIKPSDLPQVVAEKVIHTLAAMKPASLHANDASEQLLASRVVAATELKVVLHLEQPRAHKPVIDAADVKKKLRLRLRAIDPHIKISSMAKPAVTHWQVS